jgi:hypothetical protein
MLSKFDYPRPPRTLLALSKKQKTRSGSGMLIN